MFCRLIVLGESDHCTGAVCLILHIPDLNIPFGRTAEQSLLIAFPVLDIHATCSEVRVITTDINLQVVLFSGATPFLNETFYGWFCR